eukprot:gene7744-7943_t
MSKKIQLYSLATPNGQKVSVALEELGLPYDTHVIDIRKGGKELALFESGAILLYLAEKTGKLLPTDPAAKWECVSWLMFQMAGVGDRLESQDSRDRYTTEVKRLLGVLEAQLTGRTFIMGDDYTIADIAIFPLGKEPARTGNFMLNKLGFAVDASELCWCCPHKPQNFYNCKEPVGLDDFKAVNTWLQRCLERPASQVGMTVAPFPQS